MAYGDSFGGNSMGDREMHKATCADCGNECEVPFKPTEGRSVYCRECFRKHRKPSFGGGGFGGDRGGDRGGNRGGGRGGNRGGGFGGDRGRY